jgi:hypothetical protein
LELFHESKNITLSLSSASYEFKKHGIIPVSLKLGDGLHINTYVPIIYKSRRTSKPCEIAREEHRGHQVTHDCGDDHANQARHHETVVQ